MKNITYLTIIRYTVLLVFGLLFASAAIAQNVTFVDDDFRLALVAHDPVVDLNGDNQIQISEANAYTGTLILENKNISDLTGIEEFTSITRLFAGQNTFTTVDISKNTDLTYLSIHTNGMTALDISMNTELDTLIIYSNSLDGIDFSNNTKLKYINANFNNVTSIDVTNLTLLEVLAFASNQLNSVDVRSNPNLLWFIVSDNNLNSVDISNNLELFYLSVASNNISDIDLSDAPDLTQLVASENNLTELDLSNNPLLTFLLIGGNDFSTLDLSQNNALQTVFVNSSPMLQLLNLANGNNEAITSFNSTLTPNLQCIQVDNVAYAEANFTGIDGANSFSTDCSVQIPDDNFKSALLAHDPPIDANADGLLFKFEAEQFTGTLNVSSSNISDLSGIEFFTGITGLNVSGNSLTTLDISLLTDLTSLDASSNNLSELNLKNGNNSAILTFDIRGNANLKCVEVGNLDHATSTWTNKDSQTTYDTNCSLGFVDPNFKSALLTNAATIDVNMDGEIGAVEVSNFSGIINISNKSVSNPAEIALFSNAVGFIADNNQIQFLDLSQNTSLTQVSVANNSLTFLNISNGNNTNFSSFDATGNDELSCITVDDVAYSNSNWTNIPAGSGFGTDCPVYIPDTNFETALLANSQNIDLNDNNIIEYSEAVAFTGRINVNYSSITDFTGIEAFVNATEFYAVDNAATSIDLSKNVSLELINLDQNDLTEIDVSKNQALTVLLVRRNKLTELDLSNNTALERIFCGNIFSSDFNQVSLNRIQSLDFSNNPNLTYVDVFSTIVNTINLDNGNNGAITDGFQIRNSPNLSCITVSDADLLQARYDAGVHYDVGLSFSEEGCPPPIPDPNFRAALFAHDPVIDTDDDGLITLSEAAALTGKLDVSASSINNLSGIEMFVNITELDISSNVNIGDLDLSNSTALIRIDGRASELTSLDVSGLTHLVELDLGFNDLSILNLDDNTALQILDVDRNEFMTIDLDNNTNLVVLDVQRNQITTLDLTSNTKLEVLTANDNGMTSLDLFGLTVLSNVNVKNNGLTNLDLSSNTGLDTLDVFENSLVSLDVSNNPNLVFLSAMQNSLTTLTLGTNPELEYLAFRNNSVSELDISGAPKLERLIAQDNSISEIDLASNGNLLYIDLYNNPIGAIDVSQNPLLEQLYLSETNISSLDVSHNPNLTELGFRNANVSDLNLGENTGIRELNGSSNNLTEIDVSALVDLEYLYLDNNQFTSLDLSNNPILEEISITENSLIFLNIANGNNENASLSATDNPNLPCITVDNVTYAEENFNEDVDLGVSFSLGCPAVDSDILNFELSNQIGDPDIDFEAHTITISVPFGTDVTGLTPTITLPVEASISPESGTSQDFTNPFSYTVTAAESSVTQDWEITVVVEDPRTEAEITLFVLEEQTGSAVIDGNLRTISVSVEAGTDLSGLSPTIGLSGGASIAPVIDGSIDFSEPVTFTVTAEDAITTNDWVVTITAALYTGTDILTFSFEDQTSTTAINAQSHIVAIEVARGTDLNTLSPTISVSPGATVSPESDATQNFSNEVIYTVTAEDGSVQEWKVIVSELKLTGNDILTFTLNDQVSEATINVEDHIISIQVKAGTDVTSLSPTITLSEGATIDAASGVAQDFSDSVTYTVTAENGDAQEWKVGVSVEVILSPDNEIISFELPEQLNPAIIDKANHTISLVVVAGTDLTSLIPTIGVSSEASITPGSGSTQDFSSEVEYTVTAEDGTAQEWKVTVTVEEVLSAENDIIRFSFSGHSATSEIDIENHLVTIELPMGTDISTMIPEIAVSEGASIDPASGEAIDFTNPVSFMVTAEDGSQQSWTITVKVLQITGIQDELEVQVYPNPTSDRVVVRYQNHSESVLQLINHEGRLLLERNLQRQQTIELSNHPAGIYMIRIIESGSGKIHNNRVLKLD